MSEHSIVVVFDVAAPTREAAAERLAEMYRRGSVHRGNLHAYGVEAWWFPEADLKHIDGNDRDAMRLVPDDRSDRCSAIRVASDCGATVWGCTLASPHAEHQDSSGTTWHGTAVTA